MNFDRVTSHQPAIEAEGKFLQASQQLQQDKQTYGSDHIHLYVDDVEGDWLENWTWEDDLADYVDAFEHHCSQKNYQLAIETLSAGFDLLKKPENLHRGRELYDNLVELLETQFVTQLEDTKLVSLLEEARERLLELNALSGNNATENSDFQESFTMKDPRLENMQTLLDKVHNGIIRKTWRFELHDDDDPANDTFAKKGIAEAVNGEAKLELGFGRTYFNFYYFWKSQLGAEVIEEFQDEYRSAASSDEFQLISKYLEKFENAKHEKIAADIKTFPE
ncbi:MAG: hypothetical protein KME11_19395 [Timaviella obliquedivisa GSE-PSE-MK23-08B]|jgi:hypothetical protein|nr:hypothetical protein [Timaviella obliquedivisa GSE-PSE-MK23-08B]